MSHVEASHATSLLAGGLTCTSLVFLLALKVCAELTWNKSFECVGEGNVDGKDRDYNHGMTWTFLQSISVCE